MDVEAPVTPKNFQLDIKSITSHDDNLEFGFEEMIMDDGHKHRVLTIVSNKDSPSVIVSDDLYSTFNLFGIKSSFTLETKVLTRDGISNTVVVLKIKE
jgi:hypothetical protein